MRKMYALVQLEVTDDGDPIEEIKSQTLIGVNLIYVAEQFDATYPQTAGDVDVRLIEVTDMMPMSGDEDE